MCGAAQGEGEGEDEDEDEDEVGYTSLDQTRLIHGCSTNCASAFSVAVLIPQIDPETGRQKTLVLDARANTPLYGRLVFRRNILTMSPDSTNAAALRSIIGHAPRTDLEVRRRLGRWNIARAIFAAGDKSTDLEPLKKFMMRRFGKAGWLPIELCPGGSGSIDLMLDENNNNPAAQDATLDESLPPPEEDEQSTLEGGEGLHPDCIPWLDFMGGSGVADLSFLQPASQSFGEFNWSDEQCCDDRMAISALLPAHGLHCAPFNQVHRDTDAMGTPAGTPAYNPMAHLGTNFSAVHSSTHATSGLLGGNSQQLATHAPMQEAMPTLSDAQSADAVRRQVGAPNLHHSALGHADASIAPVTTTTAALLDLLLGALFPLLQNLCGVEEEEEAGRRTRVVEMLGGLAAMETAMCTVISVILERLFNVATVGVGGEDTHRAHEPVLNIAMTCCLTFAAKSAHIRALALHALLDAFVTVLSTRAASEKFVVCLRASALLSPTFAKMSHFIGLACVPIVTDGTVPAYYHSGFNGVCVCGGLVHEQHGPVQWHGPTSRNLDSKTQYGTSGTLLLNLAYCAMLPPALEVLSGFVRRRTLACLARCGALALPWNEDGCVSYHRLRLPGDATPSDALRAALTQGGFFPPRVALLRPRPPQRTVLKNVETLERETLDKESWVLACARFDVEKAAVLAATPCDAALMTACIVLGTSLEVTTLINDEADGKAAFIANAQATPAEKLRDRGLDVDCSLSSIFLAAARQLGLCPPARGMTDTAVVPLHVVTTLMSALQRVSVTGCITAYVGCTGPLWKLLAAAIESPVEANSGVLELARGVVDSHAGLPACHATENAAFARLCSANGMAGRNALLGTLAARLETETNAVLSAANIRKTLLTPGVFNCAYLDLCRMGPSILNAAAVAATGFVLLDTAPSHPCVSGVTNNAMGQALLNSFGSDYANVMQQGGGICLPLLKAHAGLLEASRRLHGGPTIFPATPSASHSSSISRPQQSRPQSLAPRRRLSSVEGRTAKGVGVATTAPVEDPMAFVDALPDEMRASVEEAEEAATVLRNTAVSVVEPRPRRAAAKRTKRTERTERTNSDSENTSTEASVGEYFSTRRNGNGRRNRRHALDDSVSSECSQVPKESPRLANGTPKRMEKSSPVDDQSQTSTRQTPTARSAFALPTMLPKTGGLQSVAKAAADAWSKIEERPEAAHKKKNRVFACVNNAGATVLHPRGMTTEERYLPGGFNRIDHSRARCLQNNDPRGDPSEVMVADWHSDSDSGLDIRINNV
jgi:hypothetical protein